MNKSLDDVYERTVVVNGTLTLMEPDDILHWQQIEMAEGTPTCGIGYEEFFCTRVHGHSGKHVANGVSTLCAIWD